MTRLSVLDLAPIVAGGDAAGAFAHSLDLARHAERWGYRRFWLAEHHNMPGIASAATALVIGHVAAGTTTIRVGAGGVMLPNHAPLMVAEQFGTLAALFPGRIDLGLGRAPGTDPATAHALRRNLAGGVQDFPRDVVELMSYFRPVQPGQRVRAVPGAGLEVPVWILGSSLFGAQLAAMLGLPFAFASHFAPDALMQALAVYRARFEPSAQSAHPWAMVGCGVIIAETDAEARHLFTSSQQRVANMFRGDRGLMQPPIDDIEAYWTPEEKEQAARMLACSFVGSVETVRRELQEFVARTKADELMVTCGVFDHGAKLRSYERLATEVAPTLVKEPTLA